MSVKWAQDNVGYDGDLLYGHVAVDYWQPCEDFERQMAEQLEKMREGMLVERDRLAADMEHG